LLNHPQGLSKYRISKKSEASFSWVHNYLHKLENKGLILKTKVVNYKGLIDFWKNIHIQPVKHDFLIKNPDELLKNTDLDYALTTYLGENLIQKYLFPTRYDIYIKNNDLNYWKEKLSSVGLVGKGNFRILVDDDHVLYNTQVIKGLRVVSIPQLILDLLIESGVCTEAAEMLILKEEPQHLQN
jgi:hypothetical protein